MTKSREKDEGERTLELAKHAPRGSSARPVVSVLWDAGSATFALPDREPCVIGRGADADIAIEARSISRRHALLFHERGLAIEDLGSANGTRVRGRAISPRERVPVDLDEPIMLGEAVLVVRPSGTPVAAGPAGARRAPRGQLRDEPSNAGDEPIISAVGEVERLVTLVAPTDMSVLLLGETGAGKGYFAKLVHDRSKRSTGPWLHINCAALPENLLESELFGYERGAFSGATQPKPGLLESASGGTVFLDEVGDLPAAVQAKLLVAIERREVLRLGALKAKPIDVRFVSATNRPRDAQGIAGLRSDLYFRLAGLPISIPPLRERADEIPSLAARFLAESSARAGRPEPALSLAALEALVAYPWPGNVRELATVIDRALLWCRDTVLEEHLRLSPTGTPSAPPPARSPDSTREPARSSGDRPRSLAAEVEDLERRGIIEALEACGGNQSRAAERLGISRRTLISRMIEFGLPRPRKG